MKWGDSLYRGSVSSGGVSTTTPSSQSSSLLRNHSMTCLTQLSNASPRMPPTGDPLIDAVRRVRDLGANPQLAQIRLVVALAYGFTPTELVPDDRHRDPVSARTTIMILAALCTRRSTGQIGQLLKRDHSTVIHALRKRGNCGITVDTVRTAFLNEAPDRVEEVASIEMWRRLRARGPDCAGSRARFPVRRHRSPREPKTTTPLAANAHAQKQFGTSPSS